MANGNPDQYVYSVNFNLYAPKKINVEQSSLEVIRIQPPIWTPNDPDDV